MRVATSPGRTPVSQSGTQNHISIKLYIHKSIMFVRVDYSRIMSCDDNLRRRAHFVKASPFSFNESQAPRPTMM